MFVSIGYNPQSLIDGNYVEFKGGVAEGLLNVLLAGTLMLIVPDVKKLFTLVGVGIAYLPWLFFDMNDLIIIIEFIILLIIYTPPELHAYKLHTTDLMKTINEQGMVCTGNEEE